MYVPKRILKNSEIAPFTKTSDEWIKKRVGISQRHVCTTETAADLGLNAARLALSDANVLPSELDLIITATVSAEQASPATACMIAGGLNVDCLAFDINSACSAFIVLFETAAAFLASGQAKKVLLVGTERLSRILDWTDPGTGIIFGDGAGAAVLEKGDGYISSKFSVKGTDEIIRIPQFVGKSPYFEGKSEEPYIFMNGQETFKYAVNAICSDVSALLLAQGLTPEDIAFVVPHQANKRIIDFAAKRLGLPSEKMFMNIDKYGNTAGASIPIALDELYHSGRLKRGDLVVFTACGGGLTSGSCLIKW